VIGYEWRMPRPRNLAQVLTAASAVLVAVSVAFLTVRFMISGFPVYVQHETTRDTSYFAPQVIEALRERSGPERSPTNVDCSSDEKVKTGMAFRCKVGVDSSDYTVRVMVLDADTGEVEVGDLSDLPR
jgi:hypothetical protein